MSYAPSNIALARGTATCGTGSSRARSSAISPFRIPPKFELAINLKAAKALGLTVPPSVFARADEVIK
jgi:hypothetical protein